MSTSLGTSAASRPLLRIDSVSRRFGGLLAVRQVSIDIAKGERRVVLGPNGAGKSTLFNLIAGDLTVSSGGIELDGTNICALPAHKRARLGIARSYQKSTLFAAMTVADNLRMAYIGRGGRHFSVSRSAAASTDGDVEATAGRVGLERLLSQPTHELSHGQQRQLELGIALAAQPRLLLLDEPAAGLSPAERELLSGLLEGLPRDLTVILIEHDMDVALPFADVVTVMHDGAVVDEGTAAHVTASDVVHRIYLGGARA